MHITFVKLWLIRLSFHHLISFYRLLCSAYSEMIIFLFIFIKRNLHEAHQNCLLDLRTEVPSTRGEIPPGVYIYYLLLHMVFRSSVLFIRTSLASCSDSDYLACQGSNVGIQWHYGIHLSSTWWWAPSLKYCKGAHSMICLEGNYECVDFTFVFGYVFSTATH